MGEREAVGERKSEEEGEFGGRRREWWKGRGGRGSEIRGAILGAGESE